MLSVRSLCLLRTLGNLFNSFVERWQVIVKQIDAISESEVVDESATDFYALFLVLFLFITLSLSLEIADEQKW